MASTNRGTDTGLEPVPSDPKTAEPLAVEPSAEAPALEQELVTTSEGLDRLLFDNPHNFEFFAAVRIIARLLPRHHPVGMDANPSEEIVRFKSHPSLSFPPSEICRLEKPNKERRRPAALTVAFMGLTGPLGALPRFYTEYVIERIRKKDHTFRDYLDLFNHRLISLFYRAWEKYRFWFGYERAELRGRARQASPQEQRWFVVNERPTLDPFSQCLLDLAGMGTPALRYDVGARDQLKPRSTIADETMRFYVGLLAQKHRSAIALEGILAAYFSLEVSVQQFQGQWLFLDREFQTSLDLGAEKASLGRNTVAGERVWDMQGRFRVRLGPLKYAQFLGFLPSGHSFQPLAHLVRLYVNQQFDFDVQLVLRHDEVPWCKLGGPEDDAARLGWNTWVRNESFTEDVADAVLFVEDVVSCSMA
jgi:type VI secretion system protein ImpH